MKNTFILIPVLAGILIAGCGTPKFYKPNGSKVLVLVEKNTLTFSNDLGVKKSGMPYLKETKGNNEFIPSAIITPVLAIGSNLIATQLKDYAKSYASEFQIKKTFIRKDQS